MLFVLRLSSGDCIVSAATDENSARDLADSLASRDGETIVSLRPLSSFALRLTPTDSGSLEVNSWADSTIDDILANEYPLLNQAFHMANSVRFMLPPNSKRPLIDQLREAHEQNTEVIRKGLHEELERFNSNPVLLKQKAAQK